MNIYKIVLDEGEYNDIEHHVLAEDFDDAVAQAHKLLDAVKEKNKKEQIVSASLEIVGIKKLFILEVVK